MTPESRKIIAAFVKRHFTNRLGSGAEGQVMWFKHRVALQSVTVLGHIHILVRDTEPAILEDWTREREWHRIS